LPAGPLRYRGPEGAVAAAGRLGAAVPVRGRAEGQPGGRRGGLRAGGLRPLPARAAGQWGDPPHGVGRDPPDPAPGETVMRRGFTVIELIVVIFIIFILLGFLGSDLGLYLVAGWGFFLARVVPQITVSAAGVLTAVVSLAVLAAGLHAFLRWL